MWCPTAMRGLGAGGAVLDGFFALRCGNECGVGRGEGSKKKPGRSLPRITTRPPTIHSVALDARSGCVPAEPYPRSSAANLSDSRPLVNRPQLRNRALRSTYSFLSSK
jgi:hypothetical protein